MGKSPSVSYKPADIENRRVKVAAMVHDGASERAIRKEAHVSGQTIRSVKAELQAEPSGKLAKDGAQLQKEHLRRLMTVSDKALGKVDTLLATEDASLRDTAVVYGILQDKVQKGLGIGQETVSVNLVVDTLSNGSPVIDATPNIVED